MPRAKVKTEARLDGKYLIATSDPHISAEDAALGYKNLLEAERGFRDLKSNLLLRPVFHRLEHRIRAHVLLCWLALLLVRVAERRTGQTWRRIATELGRVHAVALTGSSRHRRAHHPAHHRTSRHLSRMSDHTASHDHRHRPGLTRLNTATTRRQRVGTRAPTAPTAVCAAQTQNPATSCAHQLLNPGKTACDLGCEKFLYCYQVFRDLQPG